MWNNHGTCDPAMNAAKGLRALPSCIACIMKVSTQTPHAIRAGVTQHGTMIWRERPGERTNTTYRGTDTCESRIYTVQSALRERRKRRAFGNTKGTKQRVFCFHIFVFTTFPCYSPENGLQIVSLDRQSAPSRKAREELSRKFQRHQHTSSHS